MIVGLFKILSKIFENEIFTLVSNQVKIKMCDELILLKANIIKVNKSVGAE